MQTIHTRANARFALLWIAWSHGGKSAVGQSTGGSASPVRSESGVPLPPKRPPDADAAAGEPAGSFRERSQHRSGGLWPCEQPSTAAI